MSNLRVFAIVLMTTAIACKIDSLPPRSNHDGATEVGRAAGIDSGAGLDSGEASMYYVSIQVPRSMPVLDTRRSRIARWIFPWLCPSTSAQTGVRTLELNPQRGWKRKRRSAPEPRPEPGPDSGTAPLDLGPIIAVDGGTDAAPDTTAEVGPDVPITAILGVLKTGVGGGTVMPLSPGSSAVARARPTLRQARSSCSPLPPTGHPPSRVGRERATERAHAR